MIYINPRYQAAITLGRIRDRRSVEPLIHILQTDPFWGVQEGAARSLAKLRDPRALQGFGTSIAVRQAKHQARSRWKRWQQERPVTHDWLSDKGFQPEFGARPLRRTIQRELDNRLSKLVLSGEVKPGRTVTVDVDGGKLVIA